MKNNHLQKLILLSCTLALVVLASCKKYLDVAPRGNLTEVNYFENANDALLGTNAVYSTLRNAFYNEGLFPLFDIMSDDARKGSNFADGLSNVQPYDNFTFSVTSDLHANWYSTLYLGIRRANAVIVNVPAISMDATLKNRYLGEARFLRALFYLDLVRAFGSVPKVIDVTPAVKLPRDTSIYRTVILPDLEFAIANLPSTYGATDFGRATKGTAYALRARAALFFKDYALAASSAKAVIESDVYGLEPDFSNAFRPEGYFGRESVFEVGAIGIENSQGGGNEYGQTQGVRGNPNRGWGFNRPSIDLLTAFEAGDPRLDKTVIFLNEVLDGVIILGDGSTPDSTRNQDGTLLEIECYNEKVWYPGTNVPPSWGVHRKIIRYADVLLIAAEALNETGQSGEALVFLNRVRQRARGSNAGILPDIQTTDYESLKTAIWQERRVELALESHRFFDLIRTGRAATVLGPLGFRAGKNELLPIPQVEIDITEGTITQNPGW